MPHFQALVVRRSGDATTLAIEEWQDDQLVAGEVAIRVEYSSINYKDGLAARADGNVARVYPLILGIDMAGTVSDSQDERFRPGDHVIAHGYELGVSHHGGLAAQARVPASWVVPLPSHLTAREAMAIGTAGFTAALSVDRLELMGLRPGRGPVLVTGASGGVGSMAVALLAAKGYEVTASTGSQDAHEYLRQIGASDVVNRSETVAESAKALERGRWAAAVDAVGGPSLAYILRTMAYGGSVAVSGNAGGADVRTTVFPFILRGVNVLGIDSANMPVQERSVVWQRLAAELKPACLELMIHEIALSEAPRALEAVLEGRVRGRTVVKVAGSPSSS